MDKWFKDILPDKDPYHNRGRDQMRKKGGSGIRVPVVGLDNNSNIFITIIIYNKQCWNDFVGGGFEVGASLLTIRAILTGVIL